MPENTNEVGGPTDIFVIAPGNGVTAWALSAIEAAYYPGIPAPTEDRVRYRFDNGSADVATLPCRLALYKELTSRRPALRDDWAVESLHLPARGQRVEFSDFYYRPTRLARWCRTWLVPEQAGMHRFTLVTRGGVHIWVDGQLQAAFEPYDRTMDVEREISLPLRAGGSEVILLTEEMAERNTSWFFELKLLGPAPIHAELSGAAPAADSAMLRSLADCVRPDGDFVGKAGLTLLFDRDVSEPVHIHAAFRPTSHVRGIIMENDFVLVAGQTRLFICGGEALPQGYHLIELTFTMGGAKVVKTIGCAILYDEAPQWLGDDLADRKRTVLDYLASHGEPRMGTALALLAVGRHDDPRLRAIIEQTLTVIEERHDCSDFVTVPLLWAMQAYPERFPADLLARSRRAMLDYRYWVDEPGNDVMWFWSENHVLCFHTTQLLAGQLLADDMFTASGRSGRQQAALAVARLNLWFDAVERDGLAEWNSAAYYPVDFIGLFALLELAPPDIAARAHNLIDRLFEMIALHTLGGVPSGAMGRAYDKELRAGPLTELAPFATVAFGSGWLNPGVASLPQMLLSGYEPPAALLSYVEPDKGTAVTAHYVQGHGGAGRLALYKTASVQLSTSVDGHSGQLGHQQHVLDVRFAAHPFARAWINHPGEDDPWGQNRPSYWSGNGVMPRVAQYENAAMMLFDLGENPRIDFTHAYLSGTGIDHRDITGNWLICAAGTGLLAFGATSPIIPVTEGPGAGIEYRVAGTRTGWVTLVADGEGPEALAAFRAALLQTHLHFDRSGRQLDWAPPRQKPLSLHWQQGLSVDGKPYRFPNETTAPQVTTGPASTY